MALFENYERRIDKINGVLAQYGISSVEECREICKAKGFDPYEIVKGIQPICFENACWAYTVGAAIAIKSGVKSAAEAAKMIGVGLQSYDQRYQFIWLQLDLIMLATDHLSCINITQGLARQFRAVTKFLATGVATSCGPTTPRGPAAAAVLAVARTSGRWRSAGRSWMWARNWRC